MEKQFNIPEGDTIDARRASHAMEDALKDGDIPGAISYCELIIRMNPMAVEFRNLRDTLEGILKQSKKRN